MVELERAATHVAPLAAVRADDEAEPRAFLQRRLKLAVGFMTLMWALALASHLALVRAFEPSWVAELVRHPPTILHLTVTCGMALAWGLLRNRPFAQGSLRALDAGWVLVQAAAMGITLAATSPAFRPEATFVFSLSFLLILRAAVVPGTARRAAVLGFVAAIPVGIATAVSYRSETLYRDKAAWAAIGTSISLAVTVVASSLIAGTIYGLRKRVIDALALGQYRIVEKIGEGGMGVVYRATHALLKRRTAVKVMSASHATPMALARFEREVQRTSELSNPHIVSVYDFGRTEDGRFYYAMELLDGLDLETVLRADGPQPASRVVRILRQLSDALAEAHQVGLIHRDIKPSNVVVCEHARQGENVKLLDFGLVREVGDATERDAIVGTPHYMAPEAFTSPDSLDERADIYALGALGYALLTGAPVFPEGTPIELAHHHVHSPVLAPSARGVRDLPAAFEALVLQCLEKDPDDRPPTAEDVARLLDACEVPAWTTLDSDRWWEKRGEALRARTSVENAATVRHDGIAEARMRS